jgi:hypothetical protein
VEDVSAQLRNRVDARFDELLAKFYRDVPWASHLVSGDDLNIKYYKRHNIETILRIRRKRTVDAYAIRYFTLNDPETAAAWCHYTEEEMLHDRLFLGDLEKVGLTPDEVYSTEPMRATKMMMGYLLYGMEYDGSPLALLISVYLMEYVTVLTQPQWLDNVAGQIGDEAVAGARAHVNTDVDDDHADFVWKVLSSLVRTEADERRLFEHIDALYELWAAYFTQLYEETVVGDRDSRGTGDDDAATAATDLASV